MSNSIEAIEWDFNNSASSVFTAGNKGRTLKSASCMDEPEVGDTCKPRRRHPSEARVAASVKASITTGRGSSVRSVATTGGGTGACVSSSAAGTEEGEVAAEVLLEVRDDPSPPEECEDNKDETYESNTAGDVPMAATSPTT